MTRSCEECGAEIEAQRATKRLCDECIRRHNRDRNRASYAPVRHTLTCQECGGTFESRRPEAQYCLVCRQAVAARQRRDWLNRDGNRERRNQDSKDRRYARAHSLKQYGLTLEEWDAMVEAVDGKCELCGEADEALCVDHDHATGRIRGVLCRRCNRAIGQLGDTAEALRKAWEYLTRSEGTDG